MNLNHHNNILIFIPAMLILLFLSVTFFSCSDEKWNENPDFKLEFSNDTVLFDTIFSSIGTATFPLIVYNNSNAKVKLESVELCGGLESPYRINIDGNASLGENDLEIGANDSIFILVKVTIDPTDEDLPFVVMDSVRFDVNGNHQFVKLLSWGQNAHFLINKTITESTVFTSGKPYLIYDQLTLKSGVTLTLQPGTKVFFHRDALLTVESGSKILSHGTFSDPVIFRGDKLIFEEKDTIPGQWSGIWLQKGCTGNYFENTNILNAQFGIWIEGDGTSVIPDLTLYNCTVHNMLNYCLFLSNCNVKAANCQISSSGTYVVAIDGGGSYDFRHCTIGGYKTFDVTQPAEYSALYLSNFTFDSNYNIIQADLSKAYFGNCIIDGSYDEAVETDIKNGTAFNPFFENSLVKTALAPQNSSWFLNCSYENDTLFANPWRNNYSLDSLSFAKNMGTMEVINSSSLPLINDLKNNSRTEDMKPDAGCFERIEKK
jgi:hypothetical protein